MTFESGSSQGIPFVFVFTIFFTILICREIIEEYFSTRRISVFNNKYAVVRWAGYLFMIALLILYGVLDSTQFIYVSF